MIKDGTTEEGMAEGCMPWEEFCDAWPMNLNPQQQEAVRTVDGPILLLAVPGSGKTTVLVYRIGYMIYCRGIAPENILTLTFTVAAARDMKERFRNIFGEEMCGRLRFSTINSICASVIRLFARRTGKDAFPLEEDRGTTRLLAEIYRNLKGGFAAESDLKDIRTRITYIKNMMLTAEEIRELDSNCDYPLYDIYEAYRREMRRLGRMDFDDQLVYARNILRKSPEMLAVYQGQYPYVCVDEAQDTSRIQHDIIALLAARTGNLFMVGDEDQSIYGFRAAYPEALLEFEQNHPGARVLLMEKNYRSQAAIVEKADAFIQQNTLRHVKKLKATRPKAGEVRIVELKSRGAQYTYLAKVAENCSSRREAEASGGSQREAEASVSGQREAGESTVTEACSSRREAEASGVSQREAEASVSSRKEAEASESIRREAEASVRDRMKSGASGKGPVTAVLYRDNECMLPLVDLLDRQGIPFRLRQADLTYFSHRMVTDIRNIVRFAMNPRDTEAFMEIYYRISTYISKQNAQQICRRAEQEDLEVLETAERFGYLTTMNVRNIRNLQNHLRQLPMEPAEAGLNRILWQMGYGDYLQRINLSERKLYALRVIARGQENLPALFDRMDQLQTLIRERKNEEETRFVLSTIHASKGLEYDNVWLMDVVDGIFPESVPENPADLDEEELKLWEEERRLFYVGITRARNQLTLFRLPDSSAFVDEIAGEKRKKQTGAAATNSRTHAGAAFPGNNYRSAESGGFGRQPAASDDFGSFGRQPAASGDFGRQLAAYDNFGGQPADYGDNFGRQPEAYGNFRRQPAGSGGFGRQHNSFGKSPKKKEFDEADFRKFCDSLGEGVPVYHKKFGDGVVVGCSDTSVIIQFGESSRKFFTQILYQNDILRIK